MGIIEKLSDQKLLVMVKDIRILADSEAALNAGGNVRVRVESLHPQIVLRVVAETAAEKFRPAEYLKWHKSNPDALLHMMTEALRQFDPQYLRNLSRFIPREDFQKIFNLLKSLLVSKETVGNNLFVKEYVGNLGLTMESELQKHIRKGGENSSESVPGRETLKSLLMKISGDLQTLANQESISSEERVKLNGLFRFTESSVQTIESHQLLNIIYHECENKYLLQIPLLFPEGIRRGDIFVECDENGKGEGKKGKYRAVFFLSMDVLGEMMIETELREG